MKPRLCTIDSSYFNASCVLLGSSVVKAAPIIKYIIGWNMKKIQDYCERKGWTFEVHEHT